MTMKPYIAYGSNMDLQQMAYRCPDAELVGRGMLKNWRLMFKGSLTGSYATVEREKGYNVPVLIWRISADDEKRLDHYEGFPNFYYKKTVQIQKLDDNNSNMGKTRGMVYIMHEERELGLPTAHYFDVLDRAYKKFGFDENILNEALVFSDNSDKRRK